LEVFWKGKEEKSFLENQSLKKKKKKQLVQPVENSPK
jgi:hypothetical protein